MQSSKYTPICDHLEKCVVVNMPFLMVKLCSDLYRSQSCLPLNLPISKTVLPGFGLYLHTDTSLLVFLLIDCGNIRKPLRINIVSKLKLKAFIYAGRCFCMLFILCSLRR